MNNLQIKRAFQESLEDIHPSVTFQEIAIKAAKNKQSRKYKKTLISMGFISVLAFALFLSPSVSAVFESLFQYGKFEKSENREEINIGVSWKSGYSDKTFLSLEEMETTYSMHIPFPQQLLKTEMSAEGKAYRVNVDEEGKFYNYRYTLSTKGRKYEVQASNVIEEKPEFRAESSDGAAIDKEILINGTPARLMGINDINHYFIYLEKGNWKMVITISGDNNDDSKVLEQEVIKLVESIDW
jgi:hypothetical protein